MDENHYRECMVNVLLDEYGLKLILYGTLFISKLIHGRALENQFVREEVQHCIDTILDIYIQQERELDFLIRLIDLEWVSSPTLQGWFSQGFTSDTIKAFIFKVTTQY